MDPNERMTCEQLLVHPYFDKKVPEMFEKNAEDQKRRERRTNREKQQSRVANVSQSQYIRFHAVRMLTPDTDIMYTWTSWQLVGLIWGLFLGKYKISC